MNSCQVCHIMKPLYKFGTRRPAGSPSTCADCQTDPSRNICAVCRAVRPSCEFPAVERARGAQGQRCTSCIKPTAETIRPSGPSLPPVTQFKCDSCSSVMAPTHFHHSMVEDSCPFRMCKACCNQPHNNVCSRCKFLRDANGFLPEQRRRGPHVQLCIVCVEATKKKKIVTRPATTAAVKRERPDETSHQVPEEGLALYASLVSGGFTDLPPGWERRSVAELGSVCVYVDHVTREGWFETPRAVMSMKRFV